MQGSCMPPEDLSGHARKATHPITITLLRGANQASHLITMASSRSISLSQAGHPLLLGPLERQPIPQQSVHFGVQRKILNINLLLSFRNVTHLFSEHSRSGSILEFSMHVLLRNVKKGSLGFFYISVPDSNEALH